MEGNMMLPFSFIFNGIVLLAYINVYVTDLLLHLKI